MCRPRTGGSRQTDSLPRPEAFSLFYLAWTAGWGGQCLIIADIGGFNKRLLHVAAFSNKDLFVTLTYRDKSLPSTRKEAVKLLRQFFKNLRKYRNARNLLTKYIYVTEELHGEKRLHHHSR